MHELLRDGSVMRATEFSLTDNGGRRCIVDEFEQASVAVDGARFQIPRSCPALQPRHGGAGQRKPQLGQVCCGKAQTCALRARAGDFPNGAPSGPVDLPAPELGNLPELAKVRGRARLGCCHWLMLSTACRRTCGAAVQAPGENPCCAPPAPWVPGRHLSWWESSCMDQVLCA